VLHWKLITYLVMFSPQWRDAKIAWVSKTDEPAWADECLSKFLTSGGEPIASVAHSSQIFQDDKKQHFRNLKEEFPHIKYEDMLFFDNEIGNIRSVSKLGVKCVFCPDGVTKDAWEEGLSMFH
jgi:magnesium-dependent phosphatase 1